MRKITVKAITLLVSVCLLAGACCRSSVPANGKVYMGTGEQGPMTWSYDPKTKKLLVTGSGTVDGGGYDAPQWWKWEEDIETIEIRGEVKRIQAPFSTYYGLQKLTTLIFPDTVEVIGGYTFNGAEKLEHVDLPPNLREIEIGAFMETKLKKLNLPQSVTKIGADAFAGCGSLKRVVLPEGLKKINEGTFQDCSKLTTVRIPDSVVSIGKQAFAGIPFKTLTLPENIKKIGKEAFCRVLNNRLTKVTIKSKKIKTWGKNVFGTPNKKLVIEVPKSKKKAYRKALRATGLPKYVRIVGKKSLDKKQVPKQGKQSEVNG